MVDEKNLFRKSRARQFRNIKRLGCRKKMYWTLNRLRRHVYSQTQWRLLQVCRKTVSMHTYTSDKGLTSRQPWLQTKHNSKTKGTAWPSRDQLDKLGKSLIKSASQAYFLPAKNNKLPFLLKINICFGLLNGQGTDLYVSLYVLQISR